MRKTYHHAHVHHAKKSSFHAAKLFISLLTCFAAGFIGYLFTNESVHGWYLTLDKPTLNPPAWVFGPVWSILYFFMAVAVYKIKIKPNTTDVKVAIVFFYLQLILNVTWCYFFFALHSPYLGLINILILWFLIFVTTFLFFRQSSAAGWLMIPYLLWVTFASYLNFSIWFSN